MGFAIFMALLAIAAVGIFIYSFFHETKDKKQERWGLRGFSLAIVVFGAIVYGANSVSFVDQHEAGYVFNKRTGDVVTLDRPGWHIRNPILESIHAIDQRPVQVCINANTRVLNCKLVAFNPDGLELFIKMHGRSAGENGLSEILKSYAYDGSEGKYPFLSVLRELKGEYSDQDWMEQYQ